MLGTYYPPYPDLYHPINYGHIEGFIAPDGKDQDASIIGLNEPVKSFVGFVIAIVHRLDDVEEKWVVAPEGISFKKEEITEKIKFQEHFFSSEIQM